MANLNSVTITGNLTADPELRSFDNGGAICSMRVAVNGGYKNRQSGEFVEQVSFFDVEVKNNQANACATHLKKGRPVAILGRLQQNRWETPEGEGRSRVLVVASTVQFLGSPDGAPESNDTATAAEPVGVAAGAVDDDIPF